MSPYAWTITAGALPPGLSLDSATGVISGVPPSEAVGTHSFTVTVTSMHGHMASNPFSITVKGFYTATVTIGMGLLQPCQTMVYVDGEPTGSLKGGESLTLPFSFGTTHTIGIDPLVADPGDKDRRFKAADAALTVTEASPNAVFQYVTEYSVKYKAEPPGIDGLPSPDWYPEDSMLTASTTEVVDGPLGTQYRFAHWQLPTGETMAGPQLSVTVNWGGEIVAYFDTFYLLTVVSEPPGIDGLPSPDWYPEDSMLTASTTEVVDGPPGIQYRFVHWQLPTGETMAGPQLSVTVKQSGEIVAYFDTFYLLTVVSEYGTPEGSAYYKAGTNASWSVTPAEVKMSGFLGFLGGKMRAENPAGIEVITSPKTVSISWQSDYKMPILIIALVFLFIGGVSYLGYRYAQISATKPEGPIGPCGEPVKCPKCGYDDGPCGYPLPHKAHRPLPPQHACGKRVKCPTCQKDFGPCGKNYCGHTGNCRLAPRPHQECGAPVKCLQCRQDFGVCGKDCPHTGNHSPPPSHMCFVSLKCPKCKKPLNCKLECPHAGIPHQDPEHQCN
jgi:hypothetical protein